MVRFLASFSGSEEKRGMPDPEMELLVVGSPEKMTSLVEQEQEWPLQNYEHSPFSISLLLVTRVSQTPEVTHN